MIKLPSVLKNFTAFLDGVGYGGRAQECAPPKIAVVTAEHLAGGMAGTIDIDMGQVEKMEMGLTIDGIDPAFTKLLGKADTPLTLRGAISDGQTTEAVVMQARGLFKEVEFGAFKTGEKGSIKLMCTLSYFKYTVGGVDLIEVDVLGGKFIVEGVDRFADIRAALGE